MLVGYCIDYLQILQDMSLHERVASAHAEAWFRDFVFKNVSMHYVFLRAVSPHPVFEVLKLLCHFTCYVCDEFATLFLKFADNLSGFYVSSYVLFQVVAFQWGLCSMVVVFPSGCVPGELCSREKSSDIVKESNLQTTSYWWTCDTDPRDV